MKTFKTTAKRAAKWGLLGITTLAVGLTVAVVVLERRTYDVALPDLTASRDPAVIARGRYLVYGAAHCVDCHGDPGRRADAAAGQEIPLSGGYEFHLPVGTFRTANITSDAETGIGAMSDGQLARVLRHGVRRDGLALVPIMPPAANLSDDDLRAVMSYLRAQPAVRKAVVTREPNPLGHAVLAFAVKPVGPSASVPRAVAPEPNAEYGRYLVHNVAHCAGCHTERSLLTGAYTGQPLAGGMRIPSDRDPQRTFVTPNLTPAPATGRITNWTEEIFVARFKMGRGAAGSPMPWASFGRMTDDDVRAIYRYLRTVPAVENDTGPSVVDVEGTERLARADVPANP